MPLPTSFGWRGSRENGTICPQQQRRSQTDTANWVLENRPVVVQALLDDRTMLLITTGGIEPRIELRRSRRRPAASVEMGRPNIAEARRATARSASSRVNYFLSSIVTHSCNPFPNRRGSSESGRKIIKSTMHMPDNTSSGPGSQSIHVYIYIYIHICIYVYIYIYICVWIRYTYTN